MRENIDYDNLYEDQLQDAEEQENNDMPENQIEFISQLIEPNLPFDQIRRDIGLSKITEKEAELCEVYFEIARRFRHMANIARSGNNKSIYKAMLRGRWHYIEKIYELIDLRRSVSGFQWEALNKQIKEIRRKDEDKNKGLLMRNKEEN